jgi:hypothetical protein
MDTRPSSLFIFINQWLETTPPWNIQSQWSKFKRQLSSSILHELSISSHKNKKLNLNISVEMIYLNKE